MSAADHGVSTMQQAGSIENSAAGKALTAAGYMYAAAITVLTIGLVVRAFRIDTAYGVVWLFLYSWLLVSLLWIPWALISLGLGALLVKRAEHREARRRGRELLARAEQRAARPADEPGETVRILTGPFADFSGRLVGDDGETVVVEVELFGRVTSVRLARGDVAPH